MMLANSNNALWQRLRKSVSFQANEMEMEVHKYSMPIETSL